MNLHPSVLVYSDFLGDGALTTLVIDLAKDPVYPARSRSDTQFLAPQSYLLNATSVDPGAGSGWTASLAGGKVTITFATAPVSGYGVVYFYLLF